MILIFKLRTKIILNILKIVRVKYQSNSTLKTKVISITNPRFLIYLATFLNTFIYIINLSEIKLIIISKARLYIIKLI